MGDIPVSVLIPTKNEENNLKRCLDPIVEWADEILIVDSHSDDQTLEIAEEYNVKVIQFDYSGGWPKKRQWALDNYVFNNDWILLLDADEILLPAIKNEIAIAIKREDYDGYWLKFQNYFLGKQLKYGGFELWKLFLFKNGKGRYEKRLEEQTTQMADIEIHEHVVVDGKVGRLSNPIRHENWNSLFRYIQKHNEYSEWEAKVWFKGTHGIDQKFWGNQAERRRFLKNIFFNVPGFPLMLFAYHYFFRLGFLDGKQGFLYATLQAIQAFHVKTKVYELKLNDN